MSKVGRDARRLQRSFRRCNYYYFARRKRDLSRGCERRPPAAAEQPREGCTPKISRPPLHRHTHAACCTIFLFFFLRRCFYSFFSIRFLTRHTHPIVCARGRPAEHFEGRRRRTGGGRRAFSSVSPREIRVSPRAHALCFVWPHRATFSVAKRAGGGV